MKQKKKIKRLENRIKDWEKTMYHLVNILHYSSISAEKAFKCPGSIKK